MINAKDCNKFVNIAEVIYVMDFYIFILTMSVLYIYLYVKIQKVLFLTNVHLYRVEWDLHRIISLFGSC